VKVIHLDESAGARRLHGRSTFRRVLGIGLGPLAIFAGLRWLARSWYAVDLSGIPDEGQVPEQLLPWFLFHYHAGGGLWSDSMRVVVWATASLAYLLPSALGLSVARRRMEMLAATGVGIAIATWACLSIPPPPAPSEWITYFTRETVRSARMWIVALTAAGALVGAMLRILLSRRRGRLEHRS
jgi:hypothetical protein